MSSSGTVLAVWYLCASPSGYAQPFRCNGCSFGLERYKEENKLKTIFVRVFCAILVLAPAMTLPVSAFTGDMSSPVATGIDGTGAWITPGPTTISWTVLPNAGYWNYSYRIEVPEAEGGEVSHFIIETSDNFSSSDIWDIVFNEGSYVKIEIKEHVAGGSGNPGMPADVCGIKFDETTGHILDFSFKSSRMPMWGDFYIKDGDVGGATNAAWNVGLWDHPPIAVGLDASPEEAGWHMLVPDTVVPEPASLIALSTGVVGLLLRRRRRA